MFAYNGERLTLRPDGFALDIESINACLLEVPGTFRHPEGHFVLVAPAYHLERIRAWQSGELLPLGAQFVLIWVAQDQIELHPGSEPAGWGRAQRVLDRLFELGAWQVSSDGRELGLKRSLAELFEQRWPDPDIPEDATESPPRTGELTTFRRFLGDVDLDDYLHDFVRVHSSGAFSYEESSNHFTRRWEGRLAPALADIWNARIASLDFQESSPGIDELYEDRTSLRVERPGSLRQKDLDAAHPPPSFAEIVGLMAGWAQTLQTSRSPANLVDIRRIK
jgi:hypothetical protein